MNRRNFLNNVVVCGAVLSLPIPVVIKKKPYLYNQEDVTLKWGNIEVKGFASDSEIKFYRSPRGGGKLT